MSRYIFATKKLRIINDFYEKLVNSDYYNFDGIVNGALSRYFFEGMKLNQYYSEGFFNGNCQMGSLICIIALNRESKLIRGELLPLIRGKDFIHGWIETTYNGEEYVVDTSMGRVIPKELYYKALKPRVDVSIRREDLFVNDFIRYLERALPEDNNIDMTTLYNVWWPYEDNWLRDISDNSSLSTWSFDNPQLLRRIE